VADITVPSSRYPYWHPARYLREMKLGRLTVYVGSYRLTGVKSRELQVWWGNTAIVRVGHKDAAWIERKDAERFQRVRQLVNERFANGG
jgi:hypothetical protein